MDYEERCPSSQRRNAVRALITKLVHMHRRAEPDDWGGPLPTGGVRFSPTVHRAGELLDLPVSDHPPAA